MSEAEEIKVVIALRGGRASVGVQQEGCDPALFTLQEGGLEAALAQVPELVARARERWQEHPRYPKAEGLAPAPPPTPVAPVPRPAAQVPRPASPRQEEPGPRRLF